MSSIFEDFVAEQRAKEGTEGESEVAAQAMPPPAATAADARPPAADPKVESLIRELAELRGELKARVAPPPAAVSEEDAAALKAYKALKQRAAVDPVGVAEHFGYKPTEFAAKLAEYGEMTPERVAILQQQDELKAMKAQLTQMTESATKQKQSQAEVAAYHHILSTAKASGEKYELIANAPDGVVRVMNKAREMAANSQQEPDLDAIMTQVETELLDKVYGPLYSLKKLRGRSPSGSVTGAAKAGAPVVGASATTNRADPDEDARYKLAADLLFAGFRP
jgi:hypothetical protein